MASDQDAGTSPEGSRLVRQAGAGDPEVRVPRELSEEQAEALLELMEVVIPPEAPWPSAGEVVAPYDLEHRCAKRSELRAALWEILGVWRERVQARGAGSPGTIPLEQRVGEVEAAAPAQFKAVVDGVYELYYSDPRVQRIVEERTGFRVRAAVDGVSVVPQFEDVLLRVADVADRGRRVRLVGEG